MGKSKADKAYDLRLANRYQNQNRLQKAIRWLAYMPGVPLAALRCWIRDKFKALRYTKAKRQKEAADWGYAWGLPFKHCWSICVGLAQSNMEYFYTQEEVFGRLGLTNKKKRRKKKKL